MIEPQTTKQPFMCPDCGTRYGYSDDHVCKPKASSIKEIMDSRTPLSLSDTLSQFRVAVLERLNGNQIKIPDGLLLNTIFWLEAALKTQRTP